MALWHARCRPIGRIGSTAGWAMAPGAGAGLCAGAAFTLLCRRSAGYLAQPYPGQRQGATAPPATMSNRPCRPCAATRCLIATWRRGSAVAITRARFDQPVPIRGHARSHRNPCFLNLWERARPRKAATADEDLKPYLASTTNLPTACRCPSFSMAAPASASG